MTERIQEDEQSNYEIFRECASVPVLKALALPAEKPKKKPRKKGGRGHVKRNSKGGDAASSEGKEIIAENEEEKEQSNDLSFKDGDGNDAEDLGDFIDVRLSVHDSPRMHHTANPNSISQLFSSLPSPQHSDV